MKTKKSERLDKPEPTEKLHKVILHNDDITSMEFVILILKSIFDKSEADANKITMQIHHEGLSVAGSYLLGTAKAKLVAVSTMARAHSFPLRCTIENQEAESIIEEDERQELPRGWILAGSHPKDYSVLIDKKVFHGGTRSASVKHAVEYPRGFGTLMQQFSPDDYLQKRLQLKMWIKTEEVEGKVQPWMRIDGTDKGKMLGFDNCCERPISGNTDWQEFALVLDVPKDSCNIAFGILLSGRGKLWMDDISFEEVTTDVLATDCQCISGRYSKKQNPKNLSFEDIE